MNLKRFFGLALAILLVLTAIPTAALAKGAVEAGLENARLRLLDSVWEGLEAVENAVIASGAERTDVVFAVYKAALGDPRVDKESFTTVTDKSFFFTVDGMCCCYDYVARQARHLDTAEDLEPVVVIPGTKNGPANMNVLLVGPYYGYDGNFTNQYRNEAQSIADATGGTVTILQGHGATGPAIAAACPDNGVVIFDSHGTQSGSSSYLCLTTNSGITSEDYANGWAVNAGGGEAYIDGRYIEHHIDSALPNSIFWMAICEGMKRQGQGTTGYALLRAGAGCVYGYSQSVTFVGDYAIETIFWNKMKYENYTVAEAFAYMVSTGCSSNGSEPSGNAFPIVMSPLDPFPANPDSAQTVYCDWTLFGGTPVDPTGVSFTEDNYGLAPGFQLKLEPVVTPADANNYVKEWTTSDPTVAVVDNKGVVTGVNDGSAQITYTISNGNYSAGEYSYSASVTVNVSGEYLPEEVMYLPVETVVPGQAYLIGYSTTNATYIMTNEYYSTANSRTFKTQKVTLGEVAGVTCVTSDVDAGCEWVWNSNDSLYNPDAGKYLGISGNYIVLDDAAIAWHFDASNGTITNDVSNLRYLGANNTNRFFNIFNTEHELKLFRKLVRPGSEPTPEPTAVPTAEPTMEPTPEPTMVPTPEPTMVPTPEPTMEPTPEPTMEPTPEPTAEPTPEPTEQPLPGDITGDGVVDTEDALLILRAALGITELDPEQQSIADVNGDGEINTEDALLVLRMALGVN